MKKLIPDSIKPTSKFTNYGVEFYKARTTKFWDGVAVGLIVGYIPYLWHMHF
jgi:hypothetical protein